MPTCNLIRGNVSLDEPKDCQKIFVRHSEHFIIGRCGDDDDDDDDNDDDDDDDDNDDDDDDDDDEYDDYY